MIPEKLTIHEIFSRERRFVIPLFQRSYVWNKVDQWEPLWEDILHRVNAHLVHMNLEVEGKIRSHFLGAIVLNVETKVGRSIAKSAVIDGQQRLTTLQIFLAALRDQSRMHGAAEKDIKLFNRLTKNPDCDDLSEEMFRVWPTNADRETFAAVMTVGDPEALKKKYEDVEGGLPRMAQAYLFFCEQIAEFSESNESSASIEDRFYCLMLALKESLQLVVIELEEGDDPQIIFETLNARGQPLLPSDLIRNFVFMRISENEADRLYKAYWRHFDDVRASEADKDGENRFWHIDERQGRLTRRPRIDLFIFHYLAMKTESDIRIGELFREFRNWREGASLSNEEFLIDLKAHSDHFQKLIDPQGQSRLELFSRRLRALDTSTIYPLLLYLSSIEGKQLDSEELDQCIVDLESYMVRRFVCGLTPKNYNRFFLSILAKAKRAAETGQSVAVTIREGLVGSQGPTAVWPNDDMFFEGWRSRPIYVKSRSDRSAMILRALGEAMMTSRSEKLDLQGEVTVEHLLPQKGSTEDYPYGVVELPIDLDQEAYRKSLLHTVGNLTLLTGANNASASNHRFELKVQKIIENSDLRLNAWLRTNTPTKWDELDILERSENLFAHALKIWPKPSD